MKVKFEAKFAKDLRTIREPKMLNKVQEIIGECKSASSLSELNHVKAPPPAFQAAPSKGGKRLKSNCFAF